MVGVRQRLAERDGADEGAPVQEQPSSGRGGVRQRLARAGSSVVGGSSSSGMNAAAVVGRRGGVKRRLDVPDDDVVLVEDKPFSDLLRRKWAKGKFTATEVMELADTAARQGCQDLGALDTGDVRNAHRRVMRHLGCPRFAPAIEWIEVPLADGSLHPHPIICPIALVESMQNNDPARFEATIKGADGEIGKFWNGLRGHVVFEQSKECIDIGRSVPVGIHGDGAPTTKVDGLFSISWNSILGKGSTEMTRQVFSVVKKSELGNGTLDCLWKRLAWAFNALIDGVLPKRDWAGNKLSEGGRRLANGWKLAPIHLRGDWEFFTQACGFPSSTSVPNMCWLCNASPHEGPLCWTDGASTAGWRPTLRSHEDYLAELEATGRQLPGLFAIKTLRLEGIMADVLHSMDLGVTSHVVANIMVEVMQGSHWSGAKPDRLRTLQKHLDAYYREVREEHKIDGKLSQNRIQIPADWPRFKGKAAACRKLAKYGLRLAQEFNSGSAHDRLRLGVAQALCEMYDLFAGASLFLSDAARAQLEQLSIVFMAMYGRLSVEAITQGIRMWKMSPKFHLQQHICEHQSWVNPRVAWTYADEDLQRLLKGVATSCHPLNTAHMVLHKWLCIVFEQD